MNLGSSSGSYPCIMFLLICQLLKLMTSSSFCSLKEVGAQKYLLLVSSFYGPRIIVIAKLILSDLHQVSKNWSTAICKTTLHGESIYICVCIYMCVCVYIHVFIFKDVFIFIFLAPLGLLCCKRAFSDCSEGGGLLFVAAFRPLIAVTSLALKQVLGCWES